MLSIVLLALLAAPASAEDPTEMLARGMAAQRTGDAETALAAYEACLAEDPDNVPCLWELGWNRWTQADWERVVEVWGRVAALKPDHPEVGTWLPKATEHRDSLRALREMATTAPESAPSRVAPGRTLRLRAVGDIMMGTDFPDPPSHLPPEDGAHLLEAVAPLMRDADLTFGNLEGPLCDEGTTDKCGANATNCYAFRTPTRYGRYLVDAGIDLASTANNHSGDFGDLCRNRTEQTLDRLGIAWSGRPGTFASVERDGWRVAMVAFHTSPACNYVNDHAAAAELVRALDASHDLVIVSFHGGAEGSGATHVPDQAESFHGENRGHLRAFARAVIDAGADLVLGHGPHVPRGMELIDGHLVAYSLGNFATYGRFSLGGHLSTSLVLEVVLDTDGRLVSGTILPVRLLGEGVPTPDPEHTAVDLIRALTTADFPETGPVIGQDGSIGPRQP